MNADSYGAILLENQNSWVTPIAFSRLNDSKGQYEIHLFLQWPQKVLWYPKTSASINSSSFNPMSPELYIIVLHPS